jgi:hypothetical protein
VFPEGFFDLKPPSLKQSDTTMTAVELSDCRDWPRDYLLRMHFPKDVHFCWTAQIVNLKTTLKLETSISLSQKHIAAENSQMTPRSFMQPIFSRSALPVGVIFACSIFACSIFVTQVFAQNMI